MRSLGYDAPDQPPDWRQGLRQKRQEPISGEDVQGDKAAKGMEGGEGWDVRWKMNKGTEATVWAPWRLLRQGPQLCLHSLQNPLKKPGMRGTGVD